jgi:hypothetical protein
MTPVEAVVNIGLLGGGTKQLTNTLSRHKALAIVSIYHSKGQACDEKDSHV